MSEGKIRYEDWLRGCVHHDGRHGYVTLPCDEVLKIADFIERLRADRKTENCSEKPNNCEDEPQTDIHGLTDCDFCKDRRCKDCDGGKDEPQTEDFQDWKDRMWAEAVVTEPKWTCRCGFENYADFKWCFRCGCHKQERSE